MAFGDNKDKNDQGVTGAAKFVTSTVGNTVGAVTGTLGGVVGGKQMHSYAKSTGTRN